MIRLTLPFRCHRFLYIHSPFSQRRLRIKQSAMMQYHIFLLLQLLISNNGFKDTQRFLSFSVFVKSLYFGLNVLVIIRQSWVIVTLCVEAPYSWQSFIFLIRYAQFSFLFIFFHFLALLVINYINIAIIQSAKECTYLLQRINPLLYFINYCFCSIKTSNVLNCGCQNFIYNQMKISQRPPAAHKKGIKLLQAPQTTKHIESEENTIGMRSVRSSSRSRGISVSRSNGIKIDRIYEPKHFPPQPLYSQQQSNASQSQSKALSTCRSLKLVSLPSEEAMSNTRQEILKHEEVETKQNLGRDVVELNNQSIKKMSENRSTSPIAKLSFPERGGSRMQKQERQRNLLKF